jgi:hypothetical protein
MFSFKKLNIQAMKNRILTYIILSGIFLPTSCSDLLDPQPVSEILADNFWQNADHAEAGISAAYDGVANQNILRNLFAFVSIADDAVRNVPGTSGARQNMEDHQYTAARQGNTRDLWRDTFLRLQWVNDVLENVPNINDPRINNNNLRENILGEAHFLRGYIYFYMTRLYGKVPLILEVTKSVDNEVVNVTRDEIPAVFDQIISDLEAAVDMLPESYTSAEFTRGRATKGAARALLSKVYLWRGHKEFGQGDSDFQRSADLAKEVMDSPLYELVSGENFGNIFRAGAQLTSESIWEILMETDEVNGNNLQDEFQPAPIGRLRAVPTLKLINAFDARPGDLRRPFTIAEVEDPASNNGEPYYSKKHEQIGLDDPNVVILRLADIILVRAEALNELGQTDEAIELLDMIRERAGIDPTGAITQSEVRSAILEERMVELAFEGKRWYDLNRHEITIEEVESISAENNNLHHVLWPVPQEDRDRNPNLDQNPGYDGGPPLG